MFLFFRISLCGLWSSPSPLVSGFLRQRPMQNDLLPPNTAVTNVLRGTSITSLSCMVWIGTHLHLFFKGGLSSQPDIDIIQKHS
jgi:hypothetical protein